MARRFRCLIHGEKRGVSKEGGGHVGRALYTISPRAIRLHGAQQPFCSALDSLRIAIGINLPQGKDGDSRGDGTGGEFSSPEASLCAFGE